MTALPRSEETKGRYTVRAVDGGFDVFEDANRIAFFVEWRDAFLFMDMKFNGVLDVLCDWRYPFAHVARPHDTELRS